MKYLNLLMIGLIAAGCGKNPTPQPGVIRVGHFPNVTHAQAVIAHGLSRQGKGWFEERLGPDVKIEWFVFNAGPTAMEAIFANSGWRACLIFRPRAEKSNHLDFIHAQVNPR